MYCVHVPGKGYYAGMKHYKPTYSEFLHNAVIRSEKRFPEIAFTPRELHEDEYMLLSIQLRNRAKDPGVAKTNVNRESVKKIMDALFEGEKALQQGE